MSSKYRIVKETLGGGRTRYYLEVDRFGFWGVVVDGLGCAAVYESLREAKSAIRQLQSNEVVRREVVWG